METSLVDASPRVLDETVAIGPIGYGFWRFTGQSDDENARLVSTAVDVGMNLLDTADVYGLDWGGTGFGTCEEALGLVFASHRSLRDKVVLATKAGIIPGVPYDSSASYLVSACEASLRRLQVDNIDLFQIHRPDMFSHPEEVARAFESLHGRGLVRMFGVSNHTVSQTRALLRHVDVPLISTQPEFSAHTLAPLRDGTLDLCMEVGLTPLAWSPLAGGRIASGDGVRQQLVEVLDGIAAREHVSRTAVALGFVLAHPSRPVALLGTQKVERLGDAVTALSINLSRSDVYDIIEASEGAPLP